MKRRHSLSPGIPLLFLFSASLLYAQSTSMPPALPSDSPAQVFLPGFAMQNAATEADRNLGSFVDRLVAFRLGELGKVQVNPGLDSGCAAQTAQNVVQAAPAIRGPGSRPVFVVRGSIEFHPGGVGTAVASQSQVSADLILNYELTKFVNCAPQVLMRRSEPLSRLRLVESLTVIADALALRLGDELSRRTRIDIVPLKAGDSGSDEQAFATALNDALIQALARTEDLEPNDLRRSAKGTPGDFSLETALRFTRSPNPLRAFGEDVQITLRLQPRDSAEDPSARPTAYSLTSAPIRGSMNQRALLIPKAVTAALTGIAAVKEARAAGLPENLEKLNELQVNDLLIRAQEALCEGAGETCSSRPEVALALLQQAARKNAQDPQVQEWIGRAQYGSGKFLEAARSYDAVLAAGRTLPVDTALRLNTEAGDAWYRAQSFSLARARYDRAAQLLNAHPELTTSTDFNLQRSLSHRFSGDRLGALDALLHPVGASPDAAPLLGELTHLLENLNSEETDAAVARLEKETVRPELGPARVAAYEKQAGNLLGQSQYEAAEKAVRKGLALGVAGSADSLNYLLALVYFYSANQAGTSDEQKLRKYRNSSHILQQILEHDPASQSFAVIQSQISICSDYLGDKDCVHRVMAQLNGLDPASIPTGLQLDFVELQVLEGSLDLAKVSLNRVLAEKNLPSGQTTVGHFYRFWILSAEGRRQESESSFRQWEGSLKALRRSGEQIGWVFGGARRSLKNGNFAAPLREKALLQKMIQAMEDPSSSVPRFEL